MGGQHPTEATKHPHSAHSQLRHSLAKVGARGVQPQRLSLRQEPALLRLVLMGEGGRVCVCVCVSSCAYTYNRM